VETDRIFQRHYRGWKRPIDLGEHDALRSRDLQWWGSRWSLPIIRDAAGHVRHQIFRQSSQLQVFSSGLHSSTDGFLFDVYSRPAAMP
jgi:hypothetical protein